MNERSEAIASDDRLGLVESALSEARQIAARHDGVHAVHGCLGIVLNLRGFASAGYWRAEQANLLDTVMARLRRIDRTGFDSPNDQVSQRLPAEESKS